MRGNQEAYVLVKVKDGRQFVCALNRVKKLRKNNQPSKAELAINLEKDVLWQ